MATSAPPKLSKEMTKIASRWKQDIMRPHLQLQALMRGLSTHPHLTPKAVAAARTLKNDVISKRYPFPESLRRPASFPHHYDKLADGLEKARSGVEDSTPWWKSFFGL
ncbi:hypothetical protein FISHEDRAFT_73484 [Fistulina hepatica ATCC 64428]|uniref:Uncharacterized protein n=1 Tax=Fistulina hepatica ATCC 64428 TaxID=1128425 RepID=A0A0D7AF44_9AGAR|nr:hypothetical protein FISHEDRAFT_73484 [Fistulina hepatica ATCC 64428]